MRSTHRLTAAPQLLQHGHTSPGHRAARSTTVMPTGMTLHATLRAPTELMRSATCGAGNMTTSNRTACSAAVSCQPAHGRTHAWPYIYVRTAMILPRKNGFPHNVGTHAQVTHGCTRRRMANRLSQNESGTHFSPPAAKRQKQTPSIGRTAPLTTAEPHLKHGTSQHGCYNGNILHPAPGKTGPLNFPDGHSAWPPAMRLPS